MSERSGPLRAWWQFCRYAPLTAKVRVALALLAVAASWGPLAWLAVAWLTARR